MTTSHQTIVVGVDGSAGSDQAVRCAVRLAAQRSLGLRIVHGLSVTQRQSGVAASGSTGALFEAARGEGERIVRDAVVLARTVRENVSITTDMPTVPPVPLLTELSREARMVVVGHTGAGGFTGMLLGSTAAAVVSHAHCPVLVIRSPLGSLEVPDAGPVVVGLDGSPISEQAIAVAFDEASQRDVPLIAVHAWSDIIHHNRYRTTPYLAKWESIEDSEQLLLAQRLVGWQEKYPDVAVRRDVVRDRPRHALLERAATAQLLVVGSRSRGGVRGRLLGSTSQALVRHARCPVLVGDRIGDGAPASLSAASVGCGDLGPSGWGSPTVSAPGPSGVCW